MNWSIDERFNFVYIQAMQKRKIYLLSTKEYDPETIAVAFAKTSRSPESFIDIAADLNAASAAKFHERWVVGYGHASVAEHAVLHIAIENVSRLAVECIESNRLASFTEKSTRYQKWELDSYFLPPELVNNNYKKDFIQACNTLFNTYAQSIEKLKEYLKSVVPKLENETEESYDRRIHSQYSDCCRFLLPAASIANLGMTVNARELEHALGKMLSHPLVEVREIGEEIKNCALQEVPTLVKYANRIPYLEFLLSSGMAINDQDNEISPSIDKNDWCKLVSFDPDGDEKVLASFLYRFSRVTYENALMKIRRASSEEKATWCRSIMAGLDEHDQPIRELEHTNYSFDLILDQGAYAEFKRHRMMTQTSQTLTTRLGYSTPKVIASAGFENQYRSAMELAGELYVKLAEWNPQVASYIVPNGYHRRVFFTMNLREAFAFCKLRASPNAHFSIRRVAQRLAQEIKRVHPLFASYFDLPDEPWRNIENEYLI
jgi:thymidylate synthase ThyX